VAETPERPEAGDALLQRARAGHEAAQRELYEAHRARVLRLAYALLGDADDAEDVMQDVMVYALTNLNRYDPSRAALSTWLHTITLSRCRDRARRRRMGLRRVTDWLQGRAEDAVEVGPEANLERFDARLRVGQALSRLTRVQREAIVLREVVELTFEEMATVLGVPLRTAQARVTSAHAAVRRQLRGERKDGGDNDAS
jgi:RNA polymerase sigma factor (sigma-70 family)